MKVVAVSLTKIANDMRLMGSGPRAGLAEIALPELQKGSSIMPGKVNPVIPEVVTQVSAQVIGNDAAITVGGMQGHFELNVFVPLIARNLLDSIRLLAAASRLFAEKCVDGIEANRETCERYAELTLSAATALNPYIGYDKATEIVKEAAASGWSPRGRARGGRRRGDAGQGAGLSRDGDPHKAPKSATLDTEIYIEHSLLLRGRVMVGCSVFHCRRRSVLPQDRGREKDVRVRQEVSSRVWAR